MDKASLVRRLKLHLPPHCLLVVGTPPLRVRRLTAIANCRSPSACRKTRAGHRRAARLPSSWACRSSPGRGTGPVGGAMPHAQGVVLSLARFNRISARRPAGPPGRRPARRAQPGGVAGSGARLLLRARSVVAIACTLGGNVAENSVACIA